MKTDPALLPETFASLRLMGPDLDPSEVTDVVGIAPTFAYRKGDAFTPNKRTREEKRRKFGLWLYSTEKSVASRDVEDHLHRITAVLSPAMRFRGLVDERSLALTVAIFWFGAAGQSHPAVPFNFRQLVENAGGELEIDFGDEAEQDEGCAVPRAETAANATSVPENACDNT